jgi:hypothetical protein
MLNQFAYTLLYHACVVLLFFFLVTDVVKTSVVIVGTFALEDHTHDA